MHAAIIRYKTIDDLDLGYYSKTVYITTFKRPINRLKSINELLSHVPTQYNFKQLTVGFPNNITIYRIKYLLHIMYRWKGWFDSAPDPSCSEIIKQ